MKDSSAYARHTRWVQSFSSLPRHPQTTSGSSAATWATMSRTRCVACVCYGIRQSGNRAPFWLFLPSSVPQVLANAFRHKYPSFAKAKVSIGTAQHFVVVVTFVRSCMASYDAQPHALPSLGDPGQVQGQVEGLRLRLLPRPLRGPQGCVACHGRGRGVV